MELGGGGVEWAQAVGGTAVASMARFYPLCWSGRSNMGLLDSAPAEMQAQSPLELQQPYLG